MKKLAIIAATAAFALAACGETTDASTEAVADTVEVPSDDAMADLPPPVAEAEVESELTDEAAEATLNVTEEEATTAADNAVSTVDAADAAMEEMDAAEAAAEAE